MEGRQESVGKTRSRCDENGGVFKGTCLTLFETDNKMTTPIEACEHALFAVTTVEKIMSCGRPCEQFKDENFSHARQGRLRWGFSWVGTDSGENS